ncbi:MAG TPA: metal-dependent transcriptional regulator [Clostridiales bacterium]|nr:metal-dependent transcriptional regulator [Clostridiales bacterium]
MTHPPDNKNISASTEDYLEAIYLLSEEDPRVHSVAIARKLDVSRASVNKAVGLLRNSGLIVQEPYGTVSLTSKGLEQARQICQYHQVLLHFLQVVLNVTPAVAEQDACQIEHVISRETMQKLIQYVRQKEPQKEPQKGS